MNAAPHPTPHLWMGREVAGRNRVAIARCFAGTPQFENDAGILRIGSAKPWGEKGARPTLGRVEARGLTQVNLMATRMVNMESI